jgi:hypothetical protein
MAAPDLSRASTGSSTGREEERTEPVEPASAGKSPTFAFTRKTF